MTLQKALERYLQQEGLYEFLPSKSLDFGEEIKRTFSKYWIIGVVIYSSLLSSHFEKSWLIGFVTPFFALFISILLLIVFFVCRQVFLRQQFSNSDSKFLDNSVVLGLLIFGGIWFYLYIGGWLAFLSYVILYVVWTFLLAVFIQESNYYFIAQKIVQPIKAVSFTFSNIFSTIPFLLITLLLSLVSGDLLTTISKIDLINLLFIVSFICCIFYLATRTRKKIFSKITSDNRNYEEILRQVFKIENIEKAISSKYISLEDKDDAEDSIRWRDIPQQIALTQGQLEVQISRWYSRTIAFSSILVGFLFFIMFFIIFVLINPVFVKIDTSFWVTLYVPENYFAMLTTSVFLASIQVFAFWGALLDKPENSEFLQSAKEKIFDWVCVIIVLRALQCPDAEFWSAKITKPFPKQPKRKILNYKVVLRPDKTDFNIYDICQKLKDLNPASRLLRFELYRNSKKRDLDAEIAIQDWIWTQPLSRDEPILLSIPQDNIQDEELHLLGRNNWLRGDEIPDGWFGETEESALFGKKIWSLDNTHQIIMHPRVDLSDLAVFVTVRLFRKLEKSDEYRSLAEKITTLAKNQYPKKDIIEVRFYCRTLEEKIAELSWLDTQPDTYFYKDETINKLKKYRFRKN